MNKPITRKRDYCGHCKKSRVMVGDLGIDVYAVHSPFHSGMQLLIPFCRHCWTRLTAGRSQPSISLASQGFKKRLTLRQKKAAARAALRRAAKVARELEGFESEPEHDMEEGFES